jgi:hypothetical protein
MAIEDEFKQVEGMMDRSERLSHLKLMRVFLGEERFSSLPEAKELATLQEQRNVDMAVLKKLAFR